MRTNPAKPASKEERHVRKDHLVQTSLVLTLTIEEIGRDWKSGSRAWPTWPYNIPQCYIACMEKGKAVTQGCAIFLIYFNFMCNRLARVFTPS